MTIDGFVAFLGLVFLVMGIVLVHFFVREDKDREDSDGSGDPRDS